MIDNTSSGYNAATRWQLTLNDGGYVDINWDINDNEDWDDNDVNRVANIFGGKIVWLCHWKQYRSNIDELIYNPMNFDTF